MPYSVIGGDGKEYGPVDEAQLREWLAEGRLTSQSTVKDASTGQTMVLSSILSDQSAPPIQTTPPVYGQYPRPTLSAPVSEPTGPFIWLIAWCTLALVLFFILGGGGIIIAGYSVFDAIRLKSRNSKYGVPALIIAGVTLAAILIGYALRYNGSRI